MALPTFIVLGAVKAGTTSLYHYLRQHPDIQMSNWNWPRFFHLDGEYPDFDTLTARYGHKHRLESERRFSLMFPPRIPRDVKAYESLWPVGRKTQTRGEISPTYLYDAAVPARIRNRLPNVKLIVILRSPAARAYSHYIMDVRNGWEKITDFSKALLEEPVEIDDFWWGWRHYVRHGFYVAPLERFLQEFAPEQIKILVYDDYLASPHKMLCDIFRYLNVDTSFEVDMSLRYNQGQVIKATFLTSLIRSQHPAKKFFLSALPEKLILSLRRQIIDRSLVKAPAVSKEIHQQLTETFRDEVLCLQDLLNRDLSCWLT